MRRIKKLFCGVSIVLSALTINFTSKAYVEDMEIKRVYTELDNFPRNFVRDGIFGTFNSGTVNLQTKWTENWSWGSESSDFPKYCVNYFQVGTINAPYENRCLGTRDETWTDTYKFKSELSITHEESTRQMVGGSQTFRLEGSTALRGIKLKGSSETTINYELEHTISNGTRQTNSHEYSITKRYTEPGTYMLQLRANYAVIEVQEYEIVYKKIETGSKKSGWRAIDHYYEQRAVGYRLVACYNNIVQVSDAGLNICKYKLNDNGTYSYDDVRQNHNVDYI